jgi:hypothetical protein
VVGCFTYRHDSERSTVYPILQKALPRSTKHRYKHSLIYKLP